jgi:hypothetical protein
MEKKQLDYVIVEGNAGEVLRDRKRRKKQNT